MYLYGQRRNTAPPRYSSFAIVRLVEISFAVLRLLLVAIWLVFSDPGGLPSDVPYAQFLWPDLPALLESCFSL